MRSTEEKTRRAFLGQLAWATGVTTGLAALSNPVLASILPATGNSRTAEAWFKNIKGSHRVVYDAPEPHDGFPIIWPWVYYHTSNSAGTADNDMTAVVVLRHNAIPFGMEDRLWNKYKLGELHGIKDNKTGKPSLRNPYYEPQEGDFPAPMIEGIKRLQERGAMFCICEMAITVYSGMVAKQMNLDPAEVKEDYMKGLLPGIQPVPSGVWALGRAQENKCSYIYAGG